MTVKLLHDSQGKDRPWCQECHQVIPQEGHNEPCYYCHQPCNSLAGNPGKWPVALTHKDEPGVVKWHHTSCVTRRLFENIFLDGESLEAIVQDALKWREHQKALNVGELVDGESDVTPE